MKKDWQGKLEAVTGVPWAILCPRWLRVSLLLVAAWVCVPVITALLATIQLFVLWLLSLVGVML